jgi:Undecaprenyl-phosphate galactose phosphotransferase WbaP
MTPAIGKTHDLPLTPGAATSTRPAARPLAVDGPRTRPWLSASLIALADISSLILAVALSVVARHAFGADYPLSLYWHLFPVLALFVSVYALFGLYPGIVVNVVTEIRKISAATTVVFLMLAVLTFLFRVADVYSRLVFFTAWALALFSVPLGRAFIRKRCARCSWWGYSAAVFGIGYAGRMVIQQLLAQPEIGFRIKAILDSDSSGEETFCGIPVFHELESADLIARRARISHAIVAMPELPRAKLLALLESHAGVFPHLLIVPDLGGISSLGIEAKDLCRQLTLEVRRSLLLPGAQLVKRVIDITLAGSITILLLPLFAIVFVLLKLESRGAAFYTQSRLGRNGETFHIWKFRSMVHDAQNILQAYLDKHPELLDEWQRDHKLKNDPRVTRVGRILRKTSLDELPQLWNVIKGDMSLVGPRPIVQAEVAKYGTGYLLYTQVLPGITGLWQVSGRNNTTYTERVALDSYYVRNWSPWFDVYLLGRTVKVVLAGDGAY